MTIWLDLVIVRNFPHNASQWRPSFDTNGEASFSAFIMQIAIP